MSCKSKNNRNYIIILFWALIVGFLSSQSVSAQSNFEDGQRYLYSYQFVDLASSEVIANHNEKIYMMTASTQKIIIAYAALSILGPDFKFKTSAWLDPAVIDHKGNYNGDVLIRFSGDPDFSDQEIEKIIIKIKALGIKRITGRIIIDDTIFDYNAYPQGAESMDSNFCFSAPVNPIIINKNCVRVHLDNNKNSKDDNTIKLAEKKNGFLPINLTIDVKGDSQRSRMANSLELAYCENNNYKLFGYHSNKVKPPMLRIAMRNVEEGFKVWLDHYAKRYKVQIDDYNLIKLSNRPSLYKELSETLEDRFDMIYEHQSRPLKDLLHDSFIYSDNLTSNVILKYLGYNRYGINASFEDGSKAILAQLNKIGISDIIVKEGAGFRKNLNTSESLNKILIAVHKDPELWKVFRNYLPTAGEKGRGTLQGRLKNLPGKYEVLAKTGSMEGIYSLSGYILEDDDPIYAFTISLNNFEGGKDQSFRIFNEKIQDIIVKR